LVCGHIGVRASARVRPRHPDCTYPLSPIRRPPISTRFPYTTLFRSEQIHGALAGPCLGCGGEQDRIMADAMAVARLPQREPAAEDRKSTRLNSSHGSISYAVFGLKQKIEPGDGLAERVHQVVARRDA